MLNSTDLEIREVIDDTNASGFVLNEPVLNRLLELAKYLDRLAEELDARYVNFSVKPSNIDAYIWIALDELVLVDGRTDPFFEKLKLADKVSFTKSNENGALEITFRLMSLWVRT